MQQFENSFTRDRLNTLVHVDNDMVVAHHGSDPLTHFIGYLTMVMVDDVVEMELMVASNLSVRFV